MNPRRGVVRPEIAPPPPRPPTQTVAVTVMELDTNRHRSIETSQDGEIRINVLSIAYRAVCTIGYYPIRMATSLIQMGYEPYVKSERNLFGRQSYLFPNNFAYAKYIRGVDGTLGCYRGFVPFVIHDVLFRSVEGAISSRIKKLYVKSLVHEQLHNAADNILHEPAVELEIQLEFGGPEPQDMGAGDAGEDQSEAPEDTEEESPNMVVGKIPDNFLLKHTVWKIFSDIVSKAGATILCYPMRTVTLMAISEFVGRDGVLSRGFFSGIWYIYKTRGIGAFYGGLVPRLIGESINIALVGGITFGLRAYFDYIPSCLTFPVYATCSLLIGTFTYPFQVVSVTMAIAKSGFRFGCPPFMECFPDWRQCMGYLASVNMLNRGSNVMFRYYTGPLTSSGAIVPTLGINIGPDFRQGFPSLSLARL